MNFLGSNIKLLRKEKAITQDTLAKKLGVNRSMIGSYEEGRAEPKMQTLLNICHYFNTDLNSLILVDLSRTNKKTKKTDIKGEQLRILSILVDEKENNELISVVPIKASAGYTSGYGDVDFIESLHKFRLPVPEISPNKTYRVFQISGDSMLPVKPGSYIICEYIHDWYNVSNEQCHIVITKDDGIVYKRVINNLKEGHLLLKSDNPEYHPYKLQPENIIEIWRALGFISFSLPESGDINTGYGNLEDAIFEIKNDITEIKQKVQNAN